MPHDEAAPALPTRAAARVVLMAQRTRWERSLDEVTASLRASLRRRLPSLTHEHDDLLHDALAALAVFADRALREGTAPAAWCEPASRGGLEGPARDELLRVAHTILRRRVIDLFRARTRAWHAGLVSYAGSPSASAAGPFAAEPRERSLDEHASPSLPRTPEAERHALLVRMLAVCAAVAAQLDDEDRALLENAADSSDRSAPLSDRERQRLRRVRQRLTAAVRAALGDDAAALLRDEG